MIKLFRTATETIGPTGRPVIMHPTSVFRNNRFFRPVLPVRNCVECGPITHDNNRNHAVVTSVFGLRGRQTYCLNCVEIERNLWASMETSSIPSYIGFGVAAAAELLRTKRFDTLFIGKALPSLESGKDLLQWYLRVLQSHSVTKRVKKIVGVARDTVVAHELQELADEIMAVDMTITPTVPIPEPEPFISSPYVNDGITYRSSRDCNTPNPHTSPTACDWCGSVQPWDSMNGWNCMACYEYYRNVQTYSDRWVSLGTGTTLESIRSNYRTRGGSTPRRDRYNRVINDASV